MGGIVSDSRYLHLRFRRGFDVDPISTAASMKLMILRTAIPLLLALLASCSLGPQLYEVKVDSLASESLPEGRNYVLTSAMEGTPSSDLQFQELARQLHWALQDQGFIAAQNEAEADLVIGLAYGVSGPIEKKEYFRQAVWERNDVISVYRPRNYGSRRDCRTDIGYFPVPRYRVTGYTEGSRTITSYNQFLKVTARQSRQIASSTMAPELWSLECQLNSERNDLRAAFPVMLAGGRFYFGKSSGRTVTFELEEDHPDVLEIRGESLL